MVFANNVFSEVLFFILKRYVRRFAILISEVLAFCVIILSPLLEQFNIVGIHSYGVNGIYQIIVLGPVIFCLQSIVTVGFTGFGYIIASIFSIHFGKPERKNLMYILLVLAVTYVIDHCFAKYYSSDLHTLHINNSIIYLICALSGICFACSLGYVISRIPIISNILAFIGKIRLLLWRRTESCM